MGGGGRGGGGALGGLSAKCSYDIICRSVSTETASNQSIKNKQTKTHDNNHHQICKTVTEGVWEGRNSGVGDEGGWRLGAVWMEGRAGGGGGMGGGGVVVQRNRRQ